MKVWKLYLISLTSLFTFYYLMVLFLFIYNINKLVGEFCIAIFVLILLISTTKLIISEK